MELRGDFQDPFLLILNRCRDSFGSLKATKTKQIKKTFQEEVGKSECTSNKRQLLPQQSRLPERGGIVFASDDFNFDATLGALQMHFDATTASLRRRFVCNSNPLRDNFVFAVALICFSVTLM